MTDNYESQLRARLGALERAVPVSSEEALAGQTIRGRARVRSALPVGSLVAAGLVALIVVGVWRRRVWARRRGGRPPSRRQRGIPAR